MANEREGEGLDSGGATGGIWRRRRPIRAKRPAGGRSFDDDSWTWLGQEAEAAVRRPRPYLALASTAAGLALIFIGGLFLVLRNGGEDSPGEQSVHPLSTSPAASSSSGTPPALKLLVWNPAQGPGWQTGDLRIDPIGNGHQRVIPFLLRVDNATVGEIYDVAVMYSCPQQADGFEFLVEYNREDGSGAVAAPGPGRAFPDAAAPVPDDISISADDGDRGRSFQIWGATPVGVALGPQAGNCLGEKSVSIALRARAETVWMLWGGQVAMATNTPGPGEAELEMGVVVNQVETEPAKVSVVVVR